MKKVLSLAAALSVVASASFAGAQYPVEMTRDGVIYNCEASTIMVDGVKSRKCVTAGGSSEAGGGLFAAGLGAGGIALGVLGVIVLGVALDDDDEPTNGTN